MRLRHRFAAPINSFIVTSEIYLIFINCGGRLSLVVLLFFQPDQIRIVSFHCSFVSIALYSCVTMEETINHAKSILTFAITKPLSFIYLVIQQVLNFIFAPAPPPPSEKLHRPRVAVIGAGLTGVSSAAHCVGHGFDVKIFEARSKEKGLGGIWSVRSRVSFLPTLELTIYSE